MDDRQKKKGEHDGPKLGWAIGPVATKFVYAALVLIAVVAGWARGRELTENQELFVQLTIILFIVVVLGSAISRLLKKE